MKVVKRKKKKVQRNCKTDRKNYVTDHVSNTCNNKKKKKQGKNCHMVPVLGYKNQIPKKKKIAPNAAPT